METTLFIVLALASILSALLVITAPSPIASALYLVVSLFCVAGFYVLLAAPFVAALQVIVYAGAIVVLMLFVIMLLNLKAIEERLALGWQIAGISVAALILFAAFVSIMTGASFHATIPVPPSYGKVGVLGGLLFTKYVYAFEVVSVLLLLAVIGSVALIRSPEGETGNAD